MKNILFITPSLGFGGAAKMLAFVANSLAQRGHKVSIINLNLTGAETNQKLDENVKIYDYKEKLHGVKRLKTVKYIKSIAKQEKTDVIIGFTLFPNLYSVFAAKSLKIPSIISERGDPYITVSGILDKIIIRIVNTSLGGVFQTDGAKEFYGKGLQKRGTVIPNPIFIKGEIPDVKQNERDKTVVSVGRLDNYQKRYDIMIDAFEIFNKKHSEYTLKLYGDGGSVDIIKGWVTEKGLDEKVKFMGVTKQPMQDIAKDGMFLITSDYEGISNSLLEAMAAGLPCVSTDHSPGGARLLIADHENGLLAPVEDAQKLADAMCEFAENQELAEKCGNNARDVVNRFEPSKIIDMWEDYILSLTDKKKGK